MLHAGPGPLVGPDGAVLGRDYLAFYAAGRIVREGRGARLYHPALQAKAQQAVVAPERLPGFAYFAAPAPVAALHAPSTRLPYRAALLLHAALMVAAAVAGVWVLRARLPALAPHWGLCALLGIVWLPMLNSISGGQNTALSFALLALAYVALTRGARPLAGAALGVLLLKPQLALPLLAVLALRGELAVVGIAGLVGVAHYGLGAACCGWDWPARMLEGLGFFREQERQANGPFLVSILESVDFAAGRAGARGALRAALPWVVEAGAVAWLVHRWRGADPDRRDFAVFWAFGVAMTVLVSPHTQHYDLGVLLLPVLLLLNRQVEDTGDASAALRALLVLGFFAYPLYRLGPALGFQPLVLLPVAVAAWAGRGEG